MYKTGLVSISFRENTPLEIITAMKDAELSYIEWGSDIHAPKTDREKLLEIVDLQEKYNIKCCSYGTYFRLGVTPIGELIDYINAAKILGTDILRLWCGDKSTDEFSNIEKQKLFIDCKKAAKIAEENNVVLCLECHNNTYTETLLGAIEVVEYVDSPNFRMYWQPNQFRNIEENIDYAKTISSYTKHIHVFRWRGQKKFSLSEGREEWIRFLECFDGENTLLLEFMPDNDIKSLKKEANILREIIGCVKQ